MAESYSIVYMYHSFMGLVTQKFYFKKIEIFHSMLSKYDQIKIESNNKILSRFSYTASEDKK